MRVTIIPILLLSLLCTFGARANSTVADRGEVCDSIWISVGRTDSLLVSRSVAKMCEEHAVLYSPSFNYDAGKVNYKREVKHSFKITNIGTESLVILSIRTTSSSVKAKVSHKPLASGESTYMKVEYEPSKVPLGSFMRNIELTTNSCDGSITIFTLSGYSYNTDE